MTNEEMDRAIAEHVGARFFTEDGGAFWHFVTSDGRQFGRPTEDLNAMKIAEDALTGEQYLNYTLLLMDCLLYTLEASDKKTS